LVKEAYQQNLTKMKKLFLILVAAAGLYLLNGCMVELELDPPYVLLSNADEYETREVIKEVWSGDVLLYEEVLHHAWLELGFRNTGGLKAYNVQAEVIFYNGPYELSSIVIHLPDLRSGREYVYSFDTGFESVFDYTDYEVNIYWD
jgi:hypothetical protein